MQDNHKKQKQTNKTTNQTKKQTKTVLNNLIHFDKRWFLFFWLFYFCFERIITYDGYMFSLSSIFYHKPLPCLPKENQRTCTNYFFIRKGTCKFIIICHLFKMQRGSCREIIIELKLCNTFRILKGIFILNIEYQSSIHVLQITAHGLLM